MVNVALSSFLIAIPEIYLCCVALLFLFLIFILNKLNNIQQAFIVNKFYYVTATVFLLALFLLYAVGNTYVSTFSGLFIISPTIYVVKVLLIIIFAVYLLLVKNYNKQTAIADKLEYLTMVVFLLASSMLLVSSNDLLSMYVTLEATTISMYVLIFINHKKAGTLQAGFKYFLSSAVGTAFLLFGVSYLYGFTGSTNFNAIATALQQNSNNLIVVIALVTLFVGFGFKLSLAPFHMWTADVYKGVDFPTVMLLSIVSKVSALFVFLRILWIALQPVYVSWLPILQLVIVATALIGYLIMLSQTNLKRFLAYSSIANMSYMLLGFLAINTNNVQALIIYIITYTIAVFGFIGVVLMLKDTSNNNKPIQNLQDLNGLNKTNPYLAFALSVFALSMAGLPVTAGFFGKLVVLIQAFNSGFIVVATIVTLITLIAMYYYFKIIAVMYFKPSKNVLVYNFRQNQTNSIVIALCVIITLGFVFVINFITNILQSIITII